MLIRPKMTWNSSSPIDTNAKLPGKSAPGYSVSGCDQMGALYIYLICLIRPKGRESRELNVNNHEKFHGTGQLQSPGKQAVHCI